MAELIAFELTIHKKDAARVAAVPPFRMSINTAFEGSYLLLNLSLAAGKL